jgi:alpha-L-rhamnosidase
MFRRTFDVADPAAAALTVHVSGDSRYLFYCNGTLIGRGPAKGDVNHHFYETFDLAPHLRAGRNVLAALVLDMSCVAHRPALLGAPCSVMTYTGGFVLEGALRDRAGAVVTELRTDKQWRVAVDTAHRFQNENTTFEGYLGYFEHRVSSLVPAGWNLPEFNDAAWSEAHGLFKAELLENRRDPTSPYGLVPRMIPMLEEERIDRFSDVFVPGGKDAPEGWLNLLESGRAVTLPAGTEIELILDHAALTSAFPQLAVSGGAGAVLRLTYAEALRLPWGTPGATLLGKKQSLANLASYFADENTSWTFDRRGKITGWGDIWEPAGKGTAATPELFEPLHWRAYRYVGVRIKVGATPLTFHGFTQRYTAYPYKIAATFASSDARLDRVWTASLQTMRLCSHETFEDCPHYEQMQYAGDTMITSKIAMLATGDYRLSRQALYHFDWSRLSDGLTQSRYPSRLVQIIPTWSLHWITNIRDYFMCSGDATTVRDMLPGVRAVLDWYRRHTDASGLPAKLPFWNITDWCPWWPRGVVPGADSGPTTILSAQYIQGLADAAELLRQLNDPRHTNEILALEGEAARLRPVLHALTWSESEGLYFDRPGGPEVSQYGNAWAIVAGVAGERERAAIMKRFPNDEKLAPGSFFWWHTGFAALAKSGRYDEMPQHLGPWYESLDYGLTTFVEENSYWRSLCHAWSAHPALEFINRVLGVVPTAPGFARVTITPHLCGLTHAAGSVCTPLGMIEVSWRRIDEKFALTINAPAGIDITVVAPDGASTTRRFPGGTFSETFALSPVA